MCDFVSWKEYLNEVYFLTNTDLDTKQGKKLLSKDCFADIKGHGAIEHYYSELEGKGSDKECINFSTPDNFPKEIVEAIKKGQLSRIGICLDVLNNKGRAEYKKIEQPAWAEYKKIEQPAWAEYKKIQQPAWAEYEKIQQPALAEYKKIQQPALAEYKKIQQPALAEYEKIQQSAFSKIVSQKKYRKTNWK